MANTENKREHYEQESLFDFKDYNGGKLSDWQAFGRYLVAFLLTFCFAIIAGVFIVGIREHNYKHE